MTKEVRNQKSEGRRRAWKCDGSNFGLWASGLFAHSSFGLRIFSNPPIAHSNHHPTLAASMKGPRSLYLSCILSIAIATGCKKKPEAAGEQTPGPATAHEKAANSHEPSLREDSAPVGPSTESSPSASETATLAALNPDYEAWFRKYHLNLNDPKMLDADPDGDGFSNREEFLAGTDPLDPNSHPESHAGVQENIRLKEFKDVPVPFILKSVEKDTARIERLDEGPGKMEDVRTGQTLRGSPIKVEKIQLRRGTDKDGNPVDASRITLKNSNTNEETVLVKDIPTRSASSCAVITSPDGTITKTVKRGENFIWPGVAKATYSVIDIGPDQVILRQAENGKIWTVTKQ